MRKSAVLALNPFPSQVIIKYIFVQEGINATYCLSSLEGKKAWTCNNVCEGYWLREREGALSGRGFWGAFYALLYLLCSTTLPPPLRRLTLTLHRRPQVTLHWCYHRLSKTLGKKLAPRWNLIFKPATINTALKFDNKELWQKIIRFAVKGGGKCFP